MLIERRERWHLFDAGRAPGRPEIHHGDLSAQGVKRFRLTIGAWPSLAPEGLHRRLGGRCGLVCPPGRSKSCSKSGRECEKSDHKDDQSHQKSRACLTLGFFGLPLTSSAFNQLIPMTSIGSALAVVAGRPAQVMDRMHRDHDRPVAPVPDEHFDAASPTGPGRLSCVKVEPSIDEVNRDLFRMAFGDLEVENGMLGHQPFPGGARNER